METQKLLSSIEHLILVMNKLATSNIDKDYSVE